MTSSTDDDATDATDATDPATAEAEQAVIVGGCTAVRMTAPTAGFQVGIGQPITLTALATCPAGVIPEYQFWAKPAGAPNWSILGPYAQGGSTWSIPFTGTWSISAVTRAVGSTQSYQARSAAVTGTAIRANRSPVASPDGIVTTINAPGTVDVLANDSDPDGETLTLTGHGDPAHGAVSFTGSVATYTPAPGFLGDDSFTYAISDGVGGSATGTVVVTVIDQAPAAHDDALAVVSGRSATVNVLANDSDPDGDALTITSFTQPGHGTVALVDGVATYTSTDSHLGSDSFTYTIDDGHGLTATATVNVTVSAPVVGCTISISGPATGVYGQTIRLVATASCNTGPAEVQWYHRVNSSYVVVQAFGPSLTLDYPADVVGANLFYAQARTQGTTRPIATSNTALVTATDNTPQCTAVRMTSPTSGQTVSVGLAQTLTASATCPAGAVAEYQFWVKRSTTSAWTVLPGYTTGSSSWTPAQTGTWNVKAVARSVGSHVAYQVGSSAVSVTAAP